jgi:putative transposase
MPRGARILLNDACYHILNRGNQKRNIFLEDEDYGEFLKIIKHYKRVFYFKIFAYCLMPNHIHLIMQPKSPEELAGIMQRLSQVYSNWFNGKYNKCGHLWQGRFKNMVISRDDYFIECISYIEANPVRAGIVKSPKEYKWSSYKSRVFGEENALLDLPNST